LEVKKERKVINNVSYFGVDSEEERRGWVSWLPYDALEDDELHHEGLSEVAVHGLEEGNAHDEGVGKGGEGEESDEPLQGAFCEQNGPKREEEKHQELGECVRDDEPRVHLVRVVHRNEVEGEDRNGENRHEPVYAGTLLRGEHLAPFHRTVRHQHCEVQRHHGAHHLVQILSRDHLQRE